MIEFLQTITRQSNVRNDKSNEKDGYGDNDQLDYAAFNAPTLRKLTSKIRVERKRIKTDMISG
jgi:hypothetical protein